MSSEEILAIYKQYGIDMGELTSSTASPAVAEASQQKGEGPKTPSRAAKTDGAVVWKLRPGNTMEPVKISLGITDHAFTEVLAVLKGNLKEGDAVVIRSIGSKNSIPGGLGR
jgi:hypothetical protein